MGSHTRHPLRVFFIPLMSPGHMIPMVDMAKLFSQRGVAATIVTTPGNDPLVRPAIDRANSATPAPPIRLRLLLVPFPPSVTHFLPNGRENLGLMSASEHEDFFKAFFALQQPMDELLHDHHPDCIVSDSMFPWTAHTATALGIPRLIFHGPGIFPLCVHQSVELHAPHKRVSDDNEVFTVDGLPHPIAMTRAKLSSIFLFEEMLEMQREAEAKSHGIVVNSFYELEPDYADLYRSKPGRRAWYIGPVSLDRGSHADPNLASWIRWLDSMAEGSVVYVCFGSLCEFSVDQLLEISLGLESSGHPFLWVVRDTAPREWEWLPEGFEKRVEGRGVIIRGWAPQVVILNHPAVGGFVTHCGWNSTLEAVTAGVPMITWPLEYEQFVNEKFITQVVELGVSVGSAVVKRAPAIAGAVGRVMGGGEEAEGIRQRAKEYAAKAKAATEDGGSSCVDLSRLIEELHGLAKVGEEIGPGDA